MSETPVSAHTTFDCVACNATLFSGGDLLGENTSHFLFGAPISEGAVHLQKHFDEEGEQTSTVCSSCGATIGSASVQSVYDDDEIAANQTNYRILKKSLKKSGFSAHTTLPLGMFVGIVLLAAAGVGLYYLYTLEQEASANNSIHTSVLLGQDELTVEVRDARLQEVLGPDVPASGTDALIYLLSGQTKLLNLSSQHEYVLLDPNRAVRAVYRAPELGEGILSEQTDSYLLVVRSGASDSYSIGPSALLYFVAPGDLLAL